MSHTEIAYQRKTSCTAMFAVLGLMIPYTPVAMSSSLGNLGHGAGAQCEARDVSDSGTAVGSCTPGDSSSSSVAWVSILGSGETALIPLSNGKSCAGMGVINNGSVVGMCLDGSGVPFGVIWTSPTSAPRRLSPLQGLLSIGMDVRSSVAAYNNEGDVAGQSVGGGGNSTAVIWRAGSQTAVPVSVRGDNCEVADVGEANAGASPAVILNCPNGNGTTTPRLSTASGLLGTYAMADLPKADGSEYCIVAEVNVELKVIGTCAYATAPFTRAAFWADPGWTPATLNLPLAPGDSIGSRSAGAFINGPGHLVFIFQTADGHVGTGYIDPVANVPVATPPLSAGADIMPSGFGDNDLIIVNGGNASGNTQAGVFAPGTGLLAPVAPIDSGANDNLVAISRNGAYAAGGAESGTHTNHAVRTTLP